MPTNNIKRALSSPESIYFSYLPVSGDGRAMVFLSSFAYLPLDTHGNNLNGNGLDVYVKNLSAGTFQLASITAAGVLGTSIFDDPTISSDGRFAAFSTTSSELKNSTSIYPSVVVKNLLTGELLRADSDAAGVSNNGGAGQPSLSANGRYVAFASYGTNMIAGDTDVYPDVLVKDLVTGAIVKGSLTSSGGVLNAGAWEPALSADGRFLAFTSTASNVAADDYTSRVYLKDLGSGALTLVSSNAKGVPSTAASVEATVSADGRYVGFQGGPDLLANNPEFGVFLYVKDMQTGFLQMASANAAGQPANGASHDLQLSADGRFAVFVSSASNLVQGDTNGVTDVFLKDMLTGAIGRLSLSPDGVQGNGASDAAQISGDGGTVTFRSNASNLFAGDDNNEGDAFVVKIDPAFLNAWTGRITGSESGEQLTGSTVSDHLIGLGGNDSIDGGAGADMAVLRGWRADYTVTRSGASLVVRDNTGLDGTDTLTRVERLHFIDATVAYDIDGTAGQAYRLYQAAFNRTPDAGGLGFWIAQMDGGMGINAVAQAMMGSNEFTALYGAAPSNAALVDKFYLNVLHRSGEPAGVQYWNDMLDTKAVTPAQVLALISEGSENQAALIGTIENGIAYLPY
jgi:Tol biopolymer transport system component